MNDIIIKKADININKELNSINFDIKYINKAEQKYKGSAYKIYNLKPYEANILKQLSLSLGFDCAVNKDSITCKCEYSDAIIFASESQYIKLCEKLMQQPFRLKNLSIDLKKIINNKLTPIKIRNKVFDWTKPYIMGILNITPDSFSDAGKYFNINSAIKRAEELISDGADIIDIGGESIRPGANIISSEEEISRILPIIKEIRKFNTDIPLSIDTRNYETAKCAFDEGVDILNDVSGLNFDNNLYNFVTSNNIITVITHSNKVPADKNDFTEKDIIEEIYLDLFNKTEKLLNDGLNANKIIIDTGIGFGKSKESNYKILKRMEEFKSLNYPILLGISRKSFLDSTKENEDIITGLYSSMVKGINIHRVHNVKITKEYLTYAQKLL